MSPDPEVLGPDDVQIAGRKPHHDRTLNPLHAALSAPGAPPALSLRAACVALGNNAPNPDAIASLSRLAWEDDRFDSWDYDDGLCVVMLIGTEPPPRESIEEGVPARPVVWTRDDTAKAAEELAAPADETEDDEDDEDEPPAPEAPAPKPVEAKAPLLPPTKPAPKATAPRDQDTGNAYHPTFAMTDEMRVLIGERTMAIATLVMRAVAATATHTRPSAVNLVIKVARNKDDPRLIEVTAQEKIKAPRSRFSDLTSWDEVDLVKAYKTDVDPNQQMLPETAEDTLRNLNQRLKDQGVTMSIKGPGGLEASLGAKSAGKDAAAGD